MNYLTLQKRLCDALRDMGYFQHVEGHTKPAPTLEAFYSQSQPAALVRLLQVDWIPQPDAPHHYLGRARIELSLTADPAQTDHGRWQDIVIQSKRVFVAVDDSGLLVEESTLPSPLWSYRIVFTFKIGELLS